MDHDQRAAVAAVESRLVVRRAPLSPSTLQVTVRTIDPRTSTRCSAASTEPVQTWTSAGAIERIIGAAPASSAPASCARG